MADPQLTRLLQAAHAGEEGATDRLIAGVYEDLIKVARRQFGREAAGHTLQPTALVNEAWMRLEASTGDFENRGHFFGAAAQAMRRILIDHARRNQSEKRGGGQKHDTLTELGGEDEAHSIIEVDDALSALQEEDVELASIVELRFFGGLTVEEIGEIKGISPRTVKRHWRYARAWLFEKMGGEAPGD